jgi:TrmH family RNA methyltransferase
VARLARLAGRRSVRAAEGAFLVEGPNLVAEALAAGVALEAVYVEAGDRSDEIAGLLATATAAGVDTFELDTGSLRRVADTASPQPVVAVAALPSGSLDDAVAAEVVVVLVGVGDPGNAGTLLRTAEASGAGAVVFAGGSVDPWNPKCVRASAGAVFHVPVVDAGDPGPVLEELGRSGHVRLAAVVANGVPYDRVDLTGAVAIVLGNEAHGLPDGLDALIDLPVIIPMSGRAESLNVAMAGAIVCFEALRQRRRAGGSA